MHAEAASSGSRASPLAGDDVRLLELLARAFPPAAGHPADAGALEEGLAAGRPLAPILLAALDGDDVLARRRALWLVRHFHRRPVASWSERPLAPSEAFRLDVPPGVDERVVRLLDDPAAVVRFEALATHLELGGGDVTAALPHLAREISPSVLALLRLPELAWNAPWLGAELLPVLAAALDPARRVPPASGLAHVSAWGPAGAHVVARLAMAAADMTLAEPVAALDAPLWLRIELRNDGAVPADMGAPFPRLLLHEQGERYPREAEPRLFTHGVERVRVEPGTTLVWHMNLTDIYDIRSGAYGLAPPCPAPQRCAELLAFTVRGGPQPLWGEPEYRREVDPRGAPFPRRPPARIAAWTENEEAQFRRLAEEGSSEAALELARSVPLDDLSARLEALPRAVPARVPGRTRHVVWDPWGNRGAVGVGASTLSADGLVFRGTGVSIDTHRDGLHGPRTVAGLFRVARPFAGMAPPEPALLLEDVALEPIVAAGRGDDAWLVGRVLDPTSAYSQPLRRAGDLRAGRVRGGRLALEPVVADADPMRFQLDAVVVDGALHVVWNELGGESAGQRLFHRQRDSRGWGAVEALSAVSAALSGQDAHDLRVRAIGGRLHVVVAQHAQPPKWPGGMSLAEFVRTRGTWGAQRVVVDDTNLAFAATAEGEEPMFVVGQGGDYGVTRPRLAVVEAGADGELGVTEWLEFPAALENYDAGLAVARGPCRRPYLLIASDGNLVLARFDAWGRAEGVALVAGQSTDRVRFADLRLRTWPDAARGSWRYEASWGYASPEEGSALDYASDDLPGDGWEPLDRLTWRLRRSVGLSELDRRHLCARLTRDAEEADGSGRLAVAIERWLWLLETCPSTVDHDPILRIWELDRQGHPEVRRQLWRTAETAPRLLRNCPPCVSLLADDLRPRPAPVGVPGAAATP